MPCFVAKKEHARNGPRGAAQNRDEKKGPFRNPPFPQLCFSLVDPHRTEPDQAENNTPSDQKLHEKLPFFDLVESIVAEKGRGVK